MARRLYGICFLVGLEAAFCRLPNSIAFVVVGDFALDRPKKTRLFEWVEDLILRYSSKQKQCSYNKNRNWIEFTKGALSDLIQGGGAELVVSALRLHVKDLEVCRMAVRVLQASHKHPNRSCTILSLSLSFLFATLAVFSY
eukprot:5553333-Amphidinium_carterae.1